MKSNPLERGASLLLTTALHAAAGLGLLLLLSPGGARHGDAGQDKNGVLVIKLISLEQGSTANSAPLSVPRDTLAEPQPKKALAQRNSPRAVGTSHATSGERAASLGTASPALHVGSASSSLAGTNALSYRDLLLAHIARFRQYPEEAHRDRLQGSVEVGFTLNRDGSISGAWVISSSGRQIFDREALAAIHRAVPMPGIPADLPSSLDVSLPIDFEIE
ncbi:MAG: energy transducer TonB [Novosphingobium sp.]|nr:energy transducer TonB [Novosphingobium sp.]